VIFEKMIFKNAVKRLAKSQVSLLKLCVFKKTPSCLQFEKAISAFSNRNFFKTQFLSGSFSAN
jgi:hypothetical protein